MFIGKIMCYLAGKEMESNLLTYAQLLGGEQDLMISHLTELIKSLSASCGVLKFVFQLGHCGRTDRVLILYGNSAFLPSVGIRRS